MNTSTLHRVIDALIGNLEALTTELATAEHCLLEARRRCDAWPTGSHNPKVQGGESTSSTEHAALARHAIDTQLQANRDELNAAVLIIRNLRRDCQTVARKHHTILTETPRCNGGTGRDGNIEWGRPDCHNIPERHGMCIACYHRERRWRTDHGLPTRDIA